MILRTTSERTSLIARSRTIAVVGASENPLRPSNGVFLALNADLRFIVTPINPQIQHLADRPAYPSLQAYAEVHGAPDIVDVFRSAHAALEATQDAIAVGARAVWYQFGVVNPEAIALADAAGLDVVVDRCLMIDAQERA